MSEELELDQYEAEAAKRAERELRRRQMKRRKRLQIWMRRIIVVIVPIAFVTGVVFGIKALATAINNRIQEKKDAQIAAIQEENQVEPIPVEIVEVEAKEEIEDDEYGLYAQKYSADKDLLFSGYVVDDSGSIAYPSEEEVLSNYAVLIDADEGTVIAAKDANARINPASMTKILTILVAAEHVTNLDDTFRIDSIITNYVYVHDCSAVGFDNDEIVTVKDLMYGTILPSGGDAAIALAEYVAGSDELFVDMMNDKLAELGLSKTTHFTNCVGTYDENHYSTMTDMAMIMKAAVENELAKEILSAHTYTTSVTEQHPEGITISNWFLRRIEDKDTLGEVVCGKTGFVNQSGCCAASYEVSNSGKHYICVTADAWSSWRCIYDHVAMYDAYVK